MEANKLKKIMKKMEQALAAASFAEEGESGTAQSLLKEERRVLLAVKQGRTDPATVKYAINSSKRIGAAVDILYVTSSPAAVYDDGVIAGLVTEFAAEGVACRVIKKSGCMKQAVIDYTNKEKEILFAVVESPLSLDEDCSRKDTVLAELWQKLKCPLVVVMDGARA